MPAGNHASTTFWRGYVSRGAAAGEFLRGGDVLDHYIDDTHLMGVDAPWAVVGEELHVTETWFAPSDEPVQLKRVYTVDGDGELVAKSWAAGAAR